MSWCRCRGRRCVVRKPLLASHTKKIVHRDLKPSNILIFEGNVAKLADFGISRELESYTRGMETDIARGTPIWMSPEAIKAIGSTNPFQLSPLFDIFSLGLTIYFTMTGGEHLFANTREDGPFVITSNITENRPNWESIAANECTSLRNLLKPMISIDQEKRPRHALLFEHPFSWDDKKGLEFLYAVHNDLKDTNQKNVYFSDKINCLHYKFCIKNWLSCD